MTTTPKVLIDAKFAEAAESAQYISKDCRTAIDKFTATNISASNVTLTVHIMPAGSPAGPSNALTKVVAPGSTWSVPELVGHNMESGDTLSTIASAANTVWIRASGRQFT